MDVKGFAKMEQILLNDNILVRKSLNDGFIYTSQAYLEKFKEDMNVCREIFGEEKYKLYSKIYNLTKKDVETRIKNFKIK